MSGDLNKNLDKEIILVSRGKKFHLTVRDVLISELIANQINSSTEDIGEIKEINLSFVDPNRMDDIVAYMKRCQGKEEQLSKEGKGFNLRTYLSPETMELMEKMIPFECKDLHTREIKYLDNAVNSFTDCAKIDQKSLTLRENAIYEQAIEALEKGAQQNFINALSEDEKKIYYVMEKKLSDLSLFFVELKYLEIPQLTKTIVTSLTYFYHDIVIDTLH